MRLYSESVAPLNLKDVLGSANATVLALVFPGLIKMYPKLELIHEDHVYN